MLISLFLYSCTGSSGICVHMPHHVGNLRSIFGSVHDCCSSTCVCREHLSDDGDVFFQCL